MFREKRVCHKHFFVGFSSFRLGFAFLLQLRVIGVSSSMQFGPRPSILAVVIFVVRVFPFRTCGQASDAREMRSGMIYKLIVKVL